MDSKVVVITGASSGIGEAAALRLGAAGVSLVLAARRKDALEAVAGAAGTRSLVVQADVTERVQVRRIRDEALERFGHIDVWINNAGQGISRVPSELTDDDIDEVMRVNVKSAIYGMQEVLPHFKSRNRGHVINISSLLGRVPFATIRSAYCGAKHFLNAITATFRAEVQETHPDIQFTIVSPGVVQTDFGLKAKYGGPDSRQFPGAQTAEEVAVVVADVIESRLPDVYTRKGSRDQIAGYYARVGVDPGEGQAAPV
jgi:NADP-dependent 3-hydroxy acid dehydrogenase YdfG